MLFIMLEEISFLCSCECRSDKIVIKERLLSFTTKFIKKNIIAYMRNMLNMMLVTTRRYKQRIMLTYFLCSSESCMLSAICSMLSYIESKTLSKSLDRVIVVL